MSDLTRSALSADLKHITSGLSLKPFLARILLILRCDLDWIWMIECILRRIWIEHFSCKTNEGVCCSSQPNNKSLAPTLANQTTMRYLEAFNIRQWWGKCLLYKVDILPIDRTLVTFSEWVMAVENIEDLTYQYVKSIEIFREIGI